MLVTATTLLDTAANVRRFVTDNLACGVDHLVVFVDAPDAPGQDEVLQVLRDEPHVTPVATDRGWWHGRRPDRLNVRQRINANVALALTEHLQDVTWLAHIDGDEVLSVDHGVLDAVPAQAPAVWFTPLEAVSTFSPVARPTAFKRLLNPDDLTLLSVLGVIDQPTNQAYFHGHVLGKSAVRPSSGLRLTLHDPVHPDGARVRTPLRHTDPALRVLHFDAVSGEEFVRKWRTMAAAGPVATRSDRAPMVQALRRLVELDLPDDMAARYLRRVYDTTTLDDVETLGDLGLLEHVDPARGTHQPAALSSAARGRLEARLAELREVPKRDFHINHVKPGGSDGTGGPGPSSGGRRDEASGALRGAAAAARRLRRLARRASPTETRG